MQGGGTVARVRSEADAVVAEDLTHLMKFSEVDVYIKKFNLMSRRVSFKIKDGCADTDPLTWLNVSF